MNYIKKTLICMVAAGATMLVTATPVVSNVTMTQGSAGRLVTITYALTEDAVVTLDVLTNATPNAATGWASIGGAAICNAKGAVWRKVTSVDADGQGKYTITWRPDLSWTDENGKGFNIVNGCAKAVVTAWALDNTPDYMVVDISAGAQPNTQNYYPSVDFLPGGLFGNTAYRTSLLVLRKIMAKDVRWTMGSTTLESLRKTNETTHQVALTNNYYIGVFEVTQSQWEYICGTTPSDFNNVEYRAMRPVECVSYTTIRNANWPAAPNASSFLGILNSRTGIAFDLPSEAQWEFAARAGNGDTKWGDGSAVQNKYSDDNCSRLGRNKYNGGMVGSAANENPASNCGAESGTAIVGSYEPNAWGLYDTAGNVFEWCLDWWEDNIATTTDASGNLYNGRVNINPASPTATLSNASGTHRVMKGGATTQGADTCRPAYRFKVGASTATKITGLRVACQAGLQ